MANILNSIGDYLKGEYGFLTILVIIIVGIAIYTRWNRKRKLKKSGQPQQPTAPVQQVAAPQQMPEQPTMPAPVYQQRPIMQPKYEDPFMDLASLDNEGLDTIEQDTAKILSKKTEAIDKDLMKERDHVQKKISELEQTEMAIKELVSKLRLSFNDIQRQKKAYDLMNKSLGMTLQNRGGQI